MPLSCSQNGSFLPQVVIEREDGGIACGLVITSSNWYEDFVLSVRATADSLYDRDRVVTMQVKQIYVIDGVDEPEKMLKKIEVSRSFFIVCFVHSR